MNIGVEFGAYCLRIPTTVAPNPSLFKKMIPKIGGESLSFDDLSF